MLSFLKSIAYKIIFVQLGLCLGLSVLMGLFKGKAYSLSVLIGGMAYFIPNIVYVWRVFICATLRKLNQFVATFFLGEVIKLVLSAALFIFSIKYFSIDALGALIGFGFSVISFWLTTPFVLKRFAI